MGRTKQKARKMTSEQICLNKEIILCLEQGNVERLKDMKNILHQQWRVPRFLKKHILRDLSLSINAVFMLYEIIQSLSCSRHDWDEDFLKILQERRNI